MNLSIFYGFLTPHLTLLFCENGYGNGIKSKHFTLKMKDILHFA